MRKLLAAIVAAVSCASAITLAQSQLEIEANELWFVELASPPTADGTAVAHPRARGSRFPCRRQRAQAFAIRRAAFPEALERTHRPRVRARRPEAARAPGSAGGLSRGEGVAPQQVEEQPGAVADMVTAMRMTGADIAQSELGLIGPRRHVAVMDTGIDYTIPISAAVSAAAAASAKGYDLVGDAFNVESSVAELQPGAAPGSGPGRLQRSRHARGGIIGANGDRSRASLPA